MSNKITTRQVKKRRVAERDHPLWELVVNNDDISLTHIVPKLNVTDVKFLYEANKASRALIKRSSREVKSHIRKKFRIKEMSSISTLEVAWENRENKSLWPRWWRETDFCSEVAETNKLELLRWIREEKKCKWDEETMSSAASQGNLEMIKFCVANKCPVDERACTRAARNGHLEVLKYLREEVKAPVNGKVIKIAACHGDLELIRYIVEKKCAGWENGYLDALDIIAMHGHFQCLKYLHEEVKLPLNGGMIDVAASRGHLEMIRYLVGKKCEGWEDGCRDALSSAVHCGEVECLKYLHEEVKLPLNGGMIDVAASRGHLEMIRYLVGKKCEGWEDGCRDALSSAVHCGEVECLKYLHEEIKVPFDQDDEDSTIDLALRGGSTNVEMFKYLVENNCPIKEPYRTCSGLIRYQSSHHHGGRKPKGRCNFMLLECLKYLHEEVKMPLTEDTMIEAAGFGEIEIMRYLVEKKCLIGLDGRAISRAAEDGDLETIKYLYEIGAPVNERACENAAKKGHLDCLKYLHETAKAPWDSDAVREAHKRNHTDCLQYLLDNDCPLPTGWSYEDGTLHTS